MRLPQFTLRRWMVAVAILGIVLARPTAATVLILLVLAVQAQAIAQLPLRVHLTVMGSILLALLVFSAFQREAYFYYAWEADRAELLAQCASDWASVEKSPQSRAILRREAAWFSRRAVTLRGRALWEGLFHRPTSPSGGLSRRYRCRLLDLMWEMKRHEDSVRQAHAFSFPGSHRPYRPY